MIFRLGLSVALASGFSAAEAHEDWRNDLPEAAKRAVARIDQEQIDKNHQNDINADVELGKKYAAEVEKEMKVSDNAAMIARLERIGNELAEIAKTTQVAVSWGDKRLNPFPYTFKVIKQNDVNAFSLPGGYIYFHEGLMSNVESDHELAGVLAHEISHAAFRHVATLRRESEKMSLITVPLILIGIFSGGGGGAAAATLGGLLGQAVGSGWSVKAEQASDYGAIQYMLKSKYNPVGLLTFMERLATREALGPNVEWGIYRTHPPSPERAASIRQWLAQANIPIRRSEVTTTYTTQVRSGDNQTAELWFGNQRLHVFAGEDAVKRAEAAVPKLNAFFDAVPAMFEISADGNMIRGRGSELFDIDEIDAGSTGASIDTLVNNATRALKRAAFSLHQRASYGAI